MLSNNSLNAILAYKKGYKVANNKVYSRSGEVKCFINSAGYLTFSIKNKNKNVRVSVHRLLAYQKYGDKLFENGIVVRHLDGNQLNNHDCNIDIGTQSENMMDVPCDIRLMKSINASVKLRKFTDQEVEHIREKHSEHRSYKRTMKEFGISSKGTMHYILNNDYVTSV